MSVDDQNRPAARPVRCAVLTISDTRTPETDASGRTIRALLEGDGHVVAEHRIVRDDPGDIRSTLTGWIGSGDVRVVITTGGTGIAARDTSVDVITALFSIELPGFGELFRSLSYDAIGAGAMLSRATAGIAGRCAVFVLPGSEHAVRLALTTLVLPQMGHLARELEK